MSTSLLYHAFGLRGYRYVNTMYLEGYTVFRVEAKPEELRCSACGMPMSRSWKPSSRSDPWSLDASCATFRCRVHRSSR